MAHSSISTGASDRASEATCRPSAVRNSGSANTLAVIASEAADSSAPSVSTVQYMTKRPSRGRVPDTRQMRLNAASTLLSVISSEITSAITPATVRSRAAAANSFR